MGSTDIKLLENFISYCSVRNKVISQNIANIGTENYNREEVSFKNVLDQNMKAVLKSSNSKHIIPGNPSSPSAEVTTYMSQEKVSGINNVDIDKEMSDLASNSIQFRFASRKIGDYYRNLQNVIKGGGKF